MQQGSAHHNKGVPARAGYADVTFYLKLSAGVRGRKKNRVRKFGAFAHVPIGCSLVRFREKSLGINWHLSGAITTIDGHGKMV